RHIVEHVIVADTESSADHRFLIVEPARAEFWRVGEAGHGRKIVVVRIHSAGRESVGRVSIYECGGPRAGGIDVQNAIGAVPHSADAGNKIHALQSLFGGDARRLITQSDADGQVGSNLDVVQEVEGVRVAIPVAECVSGADGRGQKKALTVAVGAGSGEMIEVGEGERTPGGAVEEAASLLAA